VYPERMKITVGNAPNIGAQTNVLWDNDGGTQLTVEVYTLETVSFTPTTTGIYYFAFNCYSEADKNVLFVDDVSVSGPVEESPTFSWTSDPAGFVSSDQNPENVVVNQNTVFYVTATNSKGCTSAPEAVNVNAIPLPASPIAMHSSQCGTQVPTASVSTGGSTGTYYWYDAATGGNLLQTGGSVYALPIA